MTKKSAEFIPIKEAANRLNKSIRTISRYIKKLDSSDKNKMSKSIKGKVHVSLEFIALVQSQHFSTIKKETKTKETKEAKNKKSEIEDLEAKNKELSVIIIKKDKQLEKKDKQLEEKDQLIKENIQDFKMLTSKVLFLQEEKLQLQKPKEEKQETQPKKEEQVQKQPQIKIDTLMILIGIFATLLSFVIVYELFIEQ